MSTKYRRFAMALLMIISTAFLPAADVECEDGEFEWNWPSYSDDDCYDCGGYWYDDEWYYDSWDGYGWWWW
ncbi:MAG: hypothetical protein GXY55_10590 [Phycisphaerae bacterium]|nr:hypothetical protein [Phycisphaerae bacterium]